MVGNITCSTCKHWGKWTVNSDLGTCRKVVRFWETNENGNVVEIPSKFYVKDNEEWFAALFTRPDFGCTEHKGKEG